MRKNLATIFIALLAGLLSPQRALAQPGPQAPAEQAKPAQNPPAAAADKTPVEKHQPAADEGPKLDSQPTGTGTINVGLILKELGLSRQLDERHHKLQQKLADIYNEKKGAYEAKRKEFGEHPTDEQRKQLEHLFNECQGAVNRASENTNKHWNECVEFAQDVLRRRAAVAIKKIAKRRGLAVVIQIPNNAMAYTDDDADITLDVLAAIGPSTERAELPPLPENILADDVAGSAATPKGNPPAKKPEWTFPNLEDLLPRADKPQPPK